MSSCSLLATTVCSAASSGEPRHPAAVATNPTTSHEAIIAKGIPARVRMIFKKVSDGFALPHWTLDEAAEQPATPWRYPQE